MAAGAPHRLRVPTADCSSPSRPAELLTTLRLRPSTNDLSASTRNGGRGQRLPITTSGDAERSEPTGLTVPDDDFPLRGLRTNISGDRQERVDITVSLPQPDVPVVTSPFLFLTCKHLSLVVPILRAFRPIRTLTERKLF